MPARKLTEIAKENASGSPAVWLLVYNACQRAKVCAHKRKRKIERFARAVAANTNKSHRGVRTELAAEYRAVGSTAVYHCVRNAIINVKKKRYMALYHQEKRRSNEYYNLLTRCRARIQYALKPGGAIKSGRTNELLGCTMNVALDHLGRDLYARRAELKLEVDHIWPCDLYDLTDPEQQRMCFNYRNIRLITKKANRKKSSARPSVALASTVPRELWPPQFQ